MGEVEESDENGYEGSVWFDEEENVVCENECHVVLEDTCLNQDWHSDKNECGVVTRPTLRHGTVLQGDENEIFEQLIILYIRMKRSN